MYVSRVDLESGPVSEPEPPASMSSCPCACLYVLAYLSLGGFTAVLCMPISYSTKESLPTRRGKVKPQ